MDRVLIGAVEITRVVELQGLSRTVDEIFPDTPADTWRANTSWLAPDFWDPGTRAFRAFVQTWVLRYEGRTVLVDTGIGNGRDRPQFPRFANLHTDYLDRLAAAGVRPQDVDLVVNTHIHADHVGWNTHLVEGSWTPTFPNASYVVARADYEYFHPDSVIYTRAPRTEDERRQLECHRLLFADSIAPIEQAGQLRLWQDGHRIDGVLRLEAAPGHTPGSAVVWLETPDARAVFVGDLVHSPVQFLHADERCSFDVDPQQARTSRRRILDAAAGSGAIVFPAHFGGHGAARIGQGRGDEDFVVQQWVDLPSR
ncbi:MBL fold metallo-hydrolase [Dactylosporangium salmoneum]|uniref:MBL fold metallo-hydrolase n=1 Tax=Dactylosporangium salmoneum TaxID=53361 RepID=A0ABN3GR18_9ACTN